jgi:hypothetical protein
MLFNIKQQILEIEVQENTKYRIFSIFSLLKPKDTAVSIQI